MSSAVSSAMPSAAETAIAPDSVLDALEAEAIHVFREAAGAFRRPVMLYSIGKDSSVLLHLAVKAFAPARVRFPVLHIDTTWKFREMIAFRERMAREHELDLRVHTNAEGVQDGVTPFTHGDPRVHADHEDGGAAPGARRGCVRRRVRGRAP